MWPSKKRYNCTCKLFSRYFVSCFCLTSLPAFSSLFFTNICAYECREMMQCLLRAHQQGPPEISALHAEALFLTKAVLGGKLDMLMQLDSKIVGLGTIFVLFKSIWLQQEVKPLKKKNTRLNCAKRKKGTFKAVTQSKCKNRTGILIVLDG